jgi:glyoxylase-like metal-dependent hydrolase (beta-lactamase superfamily II)
MRALAKRFVIGSTIFIALLICLVVAGIAMYIYITEPLEDGARLANGDVTTVVTGHFGPVAIGVYIFELGDGTVGLIDAGNDRDAKAIRTALERLGKRDRDVRAIFITHAHDDHTSGLAAFPEAEAYAIEPDASLVRRRRDAVAASMTKEVHDGELLDFHNTRAEVYGVPGHTKGSAAYIARGVLFLGDAAQGLRGGTLGPNSMLSEDAELSKRSLRMLAQRLSSRQSDVHYIAFGHSGHLERLEPILKWASSLH